MAVMMAKGRAAAPKFCSGLISRGASGGCCSRPAEKECCSLCVHAAGCRLEWKWQRPHPTWLLTTLTNATSPRPSALPLPPSSHLRPCNSGKRSTLIHFGLLPSQASACREIREVRHPTGA